MPNRVKVKKSQDMITKNAVSGAGLPTLGTMILINVTNQNRILPTRNFQTGIFAKADEISGRR